MLDWHDLMKVPLREWQLLATIINRKGRAIAHTAADATDHKNDEAVDRGPKSGYR
jgi:hypothetical protein